MMIRAITAAANGLNAKITSTIATLVLVRATTIPIDDALNAAPTAHPGRPILITARNGSVFSRHTISRARLRPIRSATRIAQSNVTNLANVDSVLGQVLSGRAQIGATLNRVDAVTDRLSALKLSSQTERSNAEDLDLTQAISDFSNQQTGYDAALKAYSMVQRLSLFNYLNT